MVDNDTMYLQLELARVRGTLCEVRHRLSHEQQLFVRMPPSTARSVAEASVAVLTAYGDLLHEQAALLERLHWTHMKKTGQPCA